MDGNGTNQGTRVTLWGGCLNILLVLLKLSVGIVAGSTALIADAIHSISDLFSDVVVYIGIRLSTRPADESHAYGHGKFETIGTTIVAVLLIASGLAIAWKSGLDFHQGKLNTPGYAVLIVAVVSIMSKEWLYQITKRAARRTGSSALAVNAWHHRSDALSSVAVLIGAIAGLSGWGHGDQMAAIVVGIMIILVGINALKGVLAELTESSISDVEQQSIIDTIERVQGVRSWHRLRTRLVGRDIFMDVHIRVDAGLSVPEGHAICHTVEKAVVSSLNRDANIVVHCEPDLPAGENAAGTNNL